MSLNDWEGFVDNILSPEVFRITLPFDGPQ